MGRFTLEMVLDFSGFSRIFTILARGYMYHDRNGNLLPGDPYERMDYTRCALLAWCSIPDKSVNPRVRVRFEELHDEFPELVDENGKGWYYRHVKALLKFIDDNPELVTKALSDKQPGISTGFTAQWKKKVRQFQVPIFSLNTKGAWTVRFDDILADALEAGPLRAEEYLLNEKTKRKLSKLNIPRSCLPIAEDLASFYYANKQDDCEWVVLPIVNFNAYYRSTTFEKNKLPSLPRDIFVRETLHGLCRFKVVL